MSAVRVTVEAGHLPELENSISAVYSKVMPSTVAIFSKRNRAQIGSGTLISADGLVLTHGMGVIGKKRIGMSFDVKLSDGRMTIGKYLGVNRAYRMSWQVS